MSMDLEAAPGHRHPRFLLLLGLAVVALAGCRQDIDSRLAEIEASVEASIRTLAYSPDGANIAAGRDDGTVDVWRASTAERVHHLEAHEDWVGAVAFTADSTRLVTAGLDFKAYVWDLEKERAVQTLEGTGYVYGAALSPDGSQFVTGDDLIVWDLGTGESLKRLGTGKSRSVAFLPGGQELLAAHDDTARLWEVTTGELLLELSGHVAGTKKIDGYRPSATVQAVAVSPDGALAATGGEDGKVKLWSLPGGDELHEIDVGHHVWSLRFSPDGGRLAAAATQIFLWDVETRAKLQEMKGHESFYVVYDLAFSPDGSHLISGGADGTIRFWNLETGEQSRQIGKGRR